MLFRSSAIILPTKILQKFTFSCHWKMLMSTLCHSALLQLIRRMQIQSFSPEGMIIISREHISAWCGLLPQLMQTETQSINLGLVLRIQLFTDHLRTLHFYNVNKWFPGYVIQTFSRILLIFLLQNINSIRAISYKTHYKCKVRSDWHNPWSALYAVGWVNFP